MLTSNQFKILSSLIEHPEQSLRKLSNSSGLSLGTVSSTVKSLRQSNAITQNNMVSDHGFELLNPYKVKNAIIMAAGLSSRFAPISYEKPKGLLVVRGEVLIERQIRQLQSVGIDEIYIVLGYKKEEFFYLEDKFNVHIRVNDEYLSRNNNSTIKCVEDVLGNTYICSSDDYFTSNPFEKYVYQSYYSSTFIEGFTEEYCLKMSGKNDLIYDVTIGGENSWVMLGHAYWDKEFSSNFCEILNSIYTSPETAPKLWEDIYIEYIDRLPMVVKKYDDEIIWEFDSLDEVSLFDPSFIQNVDSNILDNICSFFDCGRGDIRNITPLKQGNTNLSFKFEIADQSYVYRHPEDNALLNINRESEVYSESIANKLGIDNTFIFEDGKTGWKIARFVDNARTLNCDNWSEISSAISLLSKLHNSGYVSPWETDLLDEAHVLLHALGQDAKLELSDLPQLAETADRLKSMASEDGSMKCLCHNAPYDKNFILDSNGNIDLIDWEYSSTSDYGYDLGTFICCSNVDYKAALRIFQEYFGRKPTERELIHCIAYTALASFYWLVWAIFMETAGMSTGEWSYNWYKTFKIYSKKAIDLNDKI